MSLIEHQWLPRYILFQVSTKRWTVGELREPGEWSTPEYFSIADPTTLSKAVNLLEELQSRELKDVGDEE